MSGSGFLSEGDRWFTAHLVIRSPDTRQLFSNVLLAERRIALFEQLALIMDKIENRNRIGICLDTSHVFAAGYDIRTPETYRKVMDTFDAIIGLENLYVIHLNDSKKELGSRVDRHEHIGEGCIGIKAFELLMNDMRFWDVPKIIETPKQKDGPDTDKLNLNRLRSLVFKK